MAAYILRNIDADLWRAVKARARADGMPVRAVLLQLLRLYAGGALVITATRPADDTREALLPGADSAV